jgi:hypothetical protein
MASIFLLFIGLKGMALRIFAGAKPFPKAPINHFDSMRIRFTTGIYLALPKELSMMVEATVDSLLSSGSE